MKTEHGVYYYEDGIGVESGDDVTHVSSRNLGAFPPASYPSPVNEERNRVSELSRLILFYRDLYVGYKCMTTHGAIVEFVTV